MNWMGVVWEGGVKDDSQVWVHTNDWAHVGVTETLLREEHWVRGPFGGVVFGPVKLWKTCGDFMSRALDLQAQRSREV